MSTKLKQAYQILSKVKKLNKAQRKKYFKSCSKDCILRICECAKNVLKGTVPIKPHHLKILARHKHTLRKLSLKSTTLKQRKRLIQNGGFIGALLPAILPLLASVIGGLFS